MDLIEQIRLAALALADFGSHLFDPTIRLGVTGLSNAGKTVFITALVHGLLRGGRFPVFEAMATGRIARGSIMRAIWTPWSTNGGGRHRRGKSASCASSSNINRSAAINAH